MFILHHVPPHGKIFIGCLMMCASHNVNNLSPISCPLVCHAPSPKSCLCMNDATATTCIPIINNKKVLSAWLPIYIHNWHMPGKAVGTSFKVVCFLKRWQSSAGSLTRSTRLTGVTSPPKPVMCNQCHSHYQMAQIACGTDSWQPALSVVIKPPSKQTAVSTHTKLLHGSLDPTY